MRDSLLLIYLIGGAAIALSVLALTFLVCLRKLTSLEVSLYFGYAMTLLAVSQPKSRVSFGAVRICLNRLASGGVFQ